MTTTRNRIEEHLLDLAWSLWTELGVAGVRRKHRQVAVMLEELLLLTSTLSTLDPRLRDEAIGWCCRYHSYVSTARLRSLLGDAPREQQTALSQFAATVNKLAATRWPTLGEAHPWQVTSKSKASLPELTRPALLHLRLRALFGTGARADVLAALLGRDPLDASIAEVARIGYTKRNIANVLDDLAAGGLLVASQTHNHLRYRWARREALEGLIAPLPRDIPNWRPVVDLILMLHRLVERTEPMPAVVRGVEAASLLPAIDRQLALLQWQPIRLGQDPEQAWDQLADWAAKVVRTIASGTMSLK